MTDVAELEEELQHIREASINHASNIAIGNDHETRKRYYQQEEEFRQKQNVINARLFELQSKQGESK